MADDPKTVSITVDSPGSRLDRFMAERFPGISRTFAQRLIEDGRVAVNGKAGKASLKLESGDEVRIELPPPAPTYLTPEEIPLSIVYEDDDLLVVDKPAGLTVHPAPGHAEHTLANAVLSHLPRLDTGDWQRPGIVHRLDKDTSGLIIVAKNSRAHEDLTNQFKQRTVSKTYFALVQGYLSPREGTIEAPIGRDRSHRERMAIVDQTHGRAARTTYRVAEHVGSFSLVEVKPVTGRTHQIRVHFAAIGHAVVGDSVYGTRSPLVARQFLHAARIGFRLPSTGQYVEFRSDLPEDLQRALAKARLSQGGAV